MKKQRDASSGPHIALAHLTKFLEFCEGAGLKWRESPDIFRSRDYDVQYTGHWMGLKWNKSFNRYTVDRRLAMVVQDFLVTAPPT